MPSELQRKAIEDRALFAKNHKDEIGVPYRDYETELLLLADLKAKDTAIAQLHEDMNRIDEQRNQFAESVAMFVSLWQQDMLQRDNPALLAVILQAKQLLKELPVKMEVVID